MPCVRLDSLSIEAMQRLAGRPHAYPPHPPPPPGAGRYREGLQTGVAHSYAPPKVR
jgi:hypothetical protein